MKALLWQNYMVCVHDLSQNVGIVPWSNTYTHKQNAMKICALFFSIRLPIDLDHDHKFVISALGHTQTACQIAYESVHNFLSYVCHHKGENVWWSLA